MPRESPNDRILIVRLTNLALLSAAALALNASGGPAGASPSTDDQAALMSAHTLLIENFKNVESRMGPDVAAALEQRIDSDVGELASDDIPPGFTPALWHARFHGLTLLDTSLVNQVTAGKYSPIAGSTALVERFFLSSVDHTWQPFALYVPSQLPAKPALVVLLHGNPQTEAELLSAPYFQSLADNTGTIIGAPWARGIPGYFPPADADVYDMTAAVSQAFHIDSNRVYLAGYSNGGFSVFKIGPEHPASWSGILCISGAIVNSETDSVRRAFANTRVYVVNGSADDQIPPEDGARTAGWLVSAGIQTGFYQQPNGTHYLPTLLPVLTRAWQDMLNNRIDPIAQSAARSQSSQAPQETQDVVLPHRG
jgi:pimeloyl-ACP methyl ester carboxylesterase